MELEDLLKRQDLPPEVRDVIKKAVQDKKSSKERLEHIVHFDSLTQLPNKKSFKENLDTLINQAERNTHTILAIIFMDIDDFKKINDTQGYKVGDLLLQMIASDLQNAVRKTDYIYRWSSDEFLIILTNLTHETDAGIVVKKLRKAIANPYKIGGQEIHITISMGISLYPNDAQDAKTLIKYADTALSTAKLENKNTFRFFTANMNKEIIKHMELENGLYRALKKNEFEVFYQPLVNSDGIILGAEALLRWRHPEMGMLLPDIFIPIAEKNGFIIQIGEWVLEQACKQIKEWQRFFIKDLYIAVNMSVRQFQDKKLIQKVKSILKKTILRPKYLIIELTESCFIKNIKAGINILKKLHNMGLKLVIDDFGTNYSSLNYIKFFPIDTIKIDRSFIRDITSDSNTKELVRAIISMAHCLKIEPLAEGVETAEQLKFLKIMGCHKMQGYFFAKPLSSNQLGNLLRLQSNRLHNYEPHIGKTAFG